MTQPRRVFIVNLNERVDIDTLTQYGKIEIMTTGYVKMGSMNFLFTKLWPQLEKASADDYLVMAGNSALCSIISTMWYKRFGICHLLIRNQSKDGTVEYNPFTIPPGDWMSKDSFNAVRDSAQTLDA
jgi:hypothetical protein